MVCRRQTSLGGNAMAAVGLGRFAYVYPTKGKQMISKVGVLGRSDGGVFTMADPPYIYDPPINSSSQ